MDKRATILKQIYGEGREAAGVLGGHYSIALRLVPDEDAVHH